MTIEYIRSKSGICKIIQELCNLIGTIVVASLGLATSKGNAYLASTIGGIIITTTFLVIFILNVQEKVALPWNKIQAGVLVAWALFLIITSSLLLNLKVFDEYVSGGLFGIFAAQAYLADAYFSFTTTAT